MKKHIKLIGLVFIFLVIALVVIFIGNNQYQFEDTITYKGNTYGLLEYNMDIFTYNYNSNNYLEEDVIHSINHNKWNIVYFNGDLFILDKQVKKANNYYSNDKNYEWFIVFDYGDSEVRKPISINSDEIAYLYNIEDVKKRKNNYLR